MNKRIIMALIGVLFMNLYSWAETTQAVTINGEIVEKAVTTITFSGDNVILQFADGKAVEADMSEVEITFTVTTNNGTATGITEFYSYNKMMGNQLVIGNISDGTPIAIYDTAGKRLISMKATSDKQSIDLNGLRKGIYLLKAGNQLVKFMKR